VTIDELEVARNIHEAVADCKKTVLACFMGASRNSAGIEYLREKNIPVYIYPEAIAKTLATIAHYRKRINARKGKIRTFAVDTGRVSEIIGRARKAGRGAIVGREAFDILDAYGIPAASYRYATSEREVVQVAHEVGLPVVMKVSTPAILHKTEFGGVMIDLRTDREVREAYRELRGRVEKEIKKGEQFTVALQQMVTGGIETVMGMTTDPSFGPLIMFGLGGIYVEVMKDVAFRINPLTTVHAGEMIRSLRSYPLLKGYRGAPPVDLKTLEDTLLRLSQLVKDFDEFSEIDINPFIASPEKEKCKAVDARFIVKDV
jgi:acyl-CoA synthetase (NDP forming)